jgi:hypothetical protein
MYKLQKDTQTGANIAVTIVGKNISIPFAPDNTDYQAYLKFLEDGGTPLPADE